MNFIVFCAISLVSAWVCSQAFKTLLNFCTTRTFKIKMLFSDGDFPSTHTTTSVAAVIVVCYELMPIALNSASEEIRIIASSVIVAVALWAAFIIRDALGIRLRVQELSKTVFKLLGYLPEYKVSPVSERFDEVCSELASGINLKVGHLPHEVIGGLILGIIFGVGASSLRASNYLVFMIDIIVFIIYTIISFTVVGRKRKK